jgi:hypothetical protein
MKKGQWGDENRWSGGGPTISCSGDGEVVGDKKTKKK